MNKTDILDSCLTGIIFESWLRFQFLDESDNKLKIAIPEPWKMEIRSLNSSLQKLAERLADKPPELADSRDAILNYINEVLDASDCTLTVQDILTNPQFLEKLDQYHLWLDQNGEILSTLEFSAWLKQFKQWQNLQCSVN